MQRLGKESLGPYVPIMLGGASQARRMQHMRLLLDAREHFLLTLCQPVDIVDEIDEQEFARQFLWQRRLQAKVEFPSAERKLAMALVIVHDGLVVKLRGADPKRVVGVR